MLGYFEWPPELLPPPIVFLREFEVFFKVACCLNITISFIY